MSIKTGQSQYQTVKVEVGPELMKFVLGYNQVNLKELREQFPALKINNGKRSIYIEGIGAALIDKCKLAVDEIINRAIVDKDNASYKKRVEKELESKRRAAAAANKIRDNIENELKTRHREEITEKIIGHMGMNVNSIKNTRHSNNKIATGMFMGLDIDDSDNE